MKTFFRNMLFYSTILFFVSQIFSGLIVFGGVASYLLGGVALTVLSFLLKPILQILSFPLNIITFGIFSFFTNAVILYVLTVFIPQIRVSAFTFTGLRFAGFVVPRVHFNTFFAYVVVALAIYGFFSFLKWLTN
ncbi:MAG: phage holin family protein [Candidatus Levyibacteriota bacterium]